MKRIFFLLVLFSFSICESSAQKEGIKTVKIGNQVWMSRNLDVDTYRNGDLIRHASTTAEWQDAANKGEGAWCYYNNDPKNGEKYGKLYNWWAVNDARGLAPKGYHVPSDAEWTTLVDVLGGESVAGKKMKSTTGWAQGGNGDNSSGFNGLPGGDCYENGDFNNVGESGIWWSSAGNNASNAWRRYLDYNGSKVGRYGYGKYYGFSVRCLRD